MLPSNTGTGARVAPPRMLGKDVGENVENSPTEGEDVGANVENSPTEGEDVGEYVSNGEDVGANVENSPTEIISDVESISYCPQTELMSTKIEKSFIILF